MPATLLKMNSFTIIFQEFCGNILSFFFYLLFRNTYFKEHLLLVAVSESIVCNISIIKKTKKIFSFSQKHIAKNRTFLSEKSKAKAKFKNTKSQKCYENFSEKKSIYTYFYYFLFIYFSLMPLRNSPPPD